MFLLNLFKIMYEVFYEEFLPIFQCFLMFLFLFLGLKFYKKQGKQERSANVMAEYLVNLNSLREDLLREYMLSRGMERAKVLSKIMEVDEQIENEKERQKESLF